VAQAPFRLRPDTTHWGSLLGPFDGHVFDQATGNPVSGALVFGSWAFENETGPAVPIAAYATSVLTASDGSYSLPALPAVQRRSALLRRFTLVVYKAGYLGYRSDLRSDDRTPRADFAQLANVVRLDRLPAGESHAQHLVFLGGGQTLLHAAQAEAIQAALELADRSPPLPGWKPESPAAVENAAAAAAAGTGTLAAQLLTPGDIAATMPSGKYDYLAEPIASNLPGDPPAGEYTGIHYRRRGQPESHDAVLRVFRTASGADAEAVWKRLSSQLSAPQLRDGSGAAPAVPVPLKRASQPLLPEVPATALPLRDASGTAYPLLPHAPPKAARGAGSLPPLHIDASLYAYDGKQRVYGVAVLVRQLGLVLELICGAALCSSEEAANGLLSRSLSRL